MKLLPWMEPKFHLQALIKKVILILVKVFKLINQQQQYEEEILVRQYRQKLRHSYLH